MPWLKLRRMRSRRDWNRLGDCQFDVAVFTNVTHEHLDYHGSVEQYRRDKARLFEMLSETSPDAPDHKRRKIAIVNLDDPFAALYLHAAGPNVEQVTYGIEHPDALVRAVRHRADPRRHDLYRTDAVGHRSSRAALPGHVQRSNSLAALTVGAAEGLSFDGCARRACRTVTV